MIVGIDEVGRGAWAGPLVVGAVLLGGADIAGLTDSKKLTKKQRTILDLQIRQSAQGIGLGWVSAKQVDQLGLTAALCLASERALRHIRHDYKEIIIDGTVSFVDDPRVTLMKKADLLIPSVSAASIVAKVARDTYMEHLDAVFPGYAFKRHVGYGTALHRQAIADNGVTPLHRLSFNPLKMYANEAKQTSVQTTRHIGDLGETAAVDYLAKHGHTIIARNWRTKYCEIDIVSQYNDTVYFTEVKYRKNNTYGDGLAAITPKKQQQITFAAELFLATMPANTNAQIAAADVSGNPARVLRFVELS